MQWAGKPTLLDLCIRFNFSSFQFFAAREVGKQTQQILIDLTLSKTINPEIKIIKKKKKKRSIEAAERD
jgi:hypothetical protein